MAARCRAADPDRQGTLPAAGSIYACPAVALSENGSPSNQCTTRRPRRRSGATLHDEHVAGTGHGGLYEGGAVGVGGAVALEALMIAVALEALMIATSVDLF